MRHQIKVTVDEAVKPGQVETGGGEAGPSSIWIRCHPSDEAKVMRELTRALKQSGATNIRKERAQ